MMLGICAARSRGDLPDFASSASFNSVSSGDIPAVLSETAYSKKRVFPSPACCLFCLHTRVASATAVWSTSLGCRGWAFPLGMPLGKVDHRIADPRRWIEEFTFIIAVVFKKTVGRLLCLAGKVKQVCRSCPVGIQSGSHPILSLPVNAGAIMHRLAGAKIHQRCWQEGPRTGGLFFRHQAWVGLSSGGIGAGTA